MKNKLTKLLAITIFSISLNAFSLLPLTPVITISTSYVSATAGTAITPVTITNAGLISYYSISPAISNGLSFNTNTGAISGVPIVASDPVTYVITATSFFTYNEDTVTVVIAVGIGDINLALGKPATQSSTYLYSYGIHAVASYAVDGNTDGKFSNRSTTHTQYEQGAWWQVDLGSQKISSKLLSTTALIIVVSID
ncbi:hypothetical protein BSPWISOXPB_4753 [uncultured Gammaproteobacteria bacterium]|nr:hypothetical protein BSPWISOXPB_4753 [uncultured Gammaproteobacteria bacterium]